MHAWHDVELGDSIETAFRAVIEIPKGSKVKYELDKPTDMRGRVDAERAIRDAAGLYREQIKPTRGRDR